MLLYAEPVYTNEEQFSVTAFVDASDSEGMLMDLTDASLKSLLLTFNSSGSNTTQESFTSRTTACGFIYDNSTVGTDSLAFGGLLK